MGTAIADYREVIEQLPAGSTLIVHDVPWDDYVRLLEEFAERPHFRVSYDRGVLEVMSPSKEHEADARLIDKLVWLHLESRDQPVESYGSTTWKLTSARMGVEPDACFFIANASRVIGRLEVHLESDPPPDVVVEIDLTNDTLKKFPIYAALGVPEIWRYDGTHMHFYMLDAGEYRPITESHAVQGLTAAMLAEALEISKTAGQTEALRAFRRHLRNSDAT